MKKISSVKLSLQSVLKVERKQFNELSINQDNIFFNQDQDEENLLNKDKVFSLEQNLKYLDLKLLEAFNSDSLNFISELGLQQQVRVCMEELLLLGIGLKPNQASNQLSKHVN